VAPAVLFAPLGRCEILFDGVNHAWGHASLK
jgi:hypothetical protein